MIHGVESPEGSTEIGDRNWSEIMEQVKADGFKIAGRHPDGQISQKDLWYTVVGFYGIRDHKNDYGKFKKENVKARREDPEYNRLFKDEDRYRKLEWNTYWDSQETNLILTVEKNTQKDLFKAYADYFGCGLAITRGSNSETVLQEIDKHWTDKMRILHFGDFNPKGFEICWDLKKRYGRKNVVMVMMQPGQVYRHPDLPQPLSKPDGQKKEFVKLWKKKKWRTVELDAYINRQWETANEEITKAILKHINRFVWVNEKVKRDMIAEQDHAVRELEDTAEHRKMRVRIAIDNRIDRIRGKHKLTPRIKRLEDKLERLKSERRQDLKKHEKKAIEDKRRAERFVDRKVSMGSARLKQRIGLIFDCGVIRESMIRDLKDMNHLITDKKKTVRFDISREIKRFEDGLRKGIDKVWREEQ